MTSSAILFNQRVGAYPTESPLISDTEVSLTGPEIVQSSIGADLINMPSAAFIGVYAAKTLFDEHLPYIMQGLVVVFNAHFIEETRRQLSGDTTVDHFSPKEKVLYDEFLLYENLLIHDTTLDPVLAELDFWIIAELQEDTHPEITRIYSDLHSWMKILPDTTRVYDDTHPWMKILPQAARVYGDTHPWMKILEDPTRVYSDTHPWMKILIRTI